MKNVIKFIISFTLLLCLNSCFSESCDNVDEFIKKLNKETEYDLNMDDFTVNKKDFYMYSTVINRNILLTLYCNEKNEIIMGTVTAKEKTAEEFEKIWTSTALILTKQEQTEPDRIAEKAELNGWCIKEIRNTSGTVILISKIDDTIHNNKLATIKETNNNKTPVY